MTSSVTWHPSALDFLEHLLPTLVHIGVKPTIPTCSEDDDVSSWLDTVETAIRESTIAEFDVFVNPGEKPRGYISETAVAIHSLSQVSSLCRTA